MIQNKSLPSFCTSNFNVIKMLIIFAKHNNLPILIETTSNQINQYGGYTYLRPKQFLKKINIIAKSLKYKEGDFPIAEEISKKILSIPMHPYLSKIDQNIIIRTLNKIEG